MTYAAVASGDFTFEQDRPLRRRSSWTGAVTMACGVLVGLLVVDGRPVGEPRRAPKAAPRATVAARGYGALLDPGSSLGFAPVSFAANAPLAAEFRFSPVPVPAADPATPAEPTIAMTTPAALPPPAPVAAEIAEDVPFPMPRPPELRGPGSQPPARPSNRAPVPSKMAGPTTVSPDNRNFLQKFFGMQQQQQSGPMLAYAAPEDGALGGIRPLTGNPMMPYDRWTAIYDISAHTVYLPNGTRLEAHSGLGDRLDDPRHVNERNRGATPPAVYDLQPRGQLFHGVRALRLNPVNGGGTFGRTGLLAHTFMLGPNGDSNGCVSFRDYDRFLQAFANGEVKRLAVVAKQI